MRVFIDTNVLLDFFTGRMGDGLAEKVILCGKSGKYEMCVSILSAVNTIYIADRCYRLKLKAEDIGSVCTVLGQRIEQWKTACGMTEVEDFEDAIQTACAIDSRCSIIISRDRHYDKCPMTVFSPQEFVGRVVL